MELKLPRGMRDFPPEEKILRDEIIALLKETFERYGFSPLETPIVERWEIVSAKYAGGEEILKEVFRLKDQGGRELALRYELTTGLARFVGMNPTIKRPFKRYQMGLVYRDGPIKKGRTRELYQCDVDTVGTESMLADAELLNLALDFFKRIDFDIEIRVNNRKILKDLAQKFSIPKEVIDSVILTLDKLEKVGRAEVEKELVEKGGGSTAGSIAWLETLVKASGKTNEEKIQNLRAAAKSEGLSEIEELLKYTDDQERVVFTPSLARGLAYYTGPVFEVYLRNSDFTSSLAAGGRYDELIGNFIGTGEKYPAVGISFGLEPIMEVFKERRLKAKESLKKAVTQVFVIPIRSSEEILNQSRKIAQKLRQAGINTDMDLVGKGISSNLEYANAYNIPYALIVGPKELEQDKVKLRDMISGEEALLTLEQVIKKLEG